MNTLLCPALTLTIKRLSPKFFDKGLIFVYIEEFRNGYAVVEIKDTTSEGTEIVLRKIQTYKDYVSYYELLKIRLEKFKKKYNEEYSIGF